MEGFSILDFRLSNYIFDKAFESVLRNFYGFGVYRPFPSLKYHILATPIKVGWVLGLGF